MNKTFLHIAHKAALPLALMAMLLGLPASGHAERIKDIAGFEGVRGNKVIGYGLVAGLDGTGDKGDSTLQSIANMLRRMGLSVSAEDLKAKNTAAVIVTATLPPFPKPGVRVDALVSTIGDAKNLQGGTLLLTPLKGPDGKDYALAQGPVSIGGFVGGSGGNRVQKNHPTSGIVPRGAVVEVEPAFTLGDGESIRLFLNEPDFTTASAVSGRINQALGGSYASTLDPSAVRVTLPEAYRGRTVELVALVEGLDVTVDTVARVVVNERTGTVVIGENVRIQPVAIAHGSLTIEITTDLAVSQPPSFAPESANTVVVPEQDVNVREREASLIEVRGVTLGEVVRALNSLGVTPRDLVAILQALKAAGALGAELEII